MYGRINFSLIDTDPGANTAFAPPAGFEGDYKAFLTERSVSDTGARQHIALVASLLRRRDGVTPEFTGKYARHALWMMERYKPI
ncbi:hypothetical protein [Acidovorax sp. sic0104]|uniref:hypothetical protein n=1 Tax=Acidovorax sp. sic0104 TaxID=2854784 RepID=UPI001C4835C1|nr:hypothetical protein [Acidovorax sp. sic0104]MBV7542150.1 hypothetical protein [Acidovorax sp. sic0104]